jgi:hypothetical protein
MSFETPESARAALDEKIANIDPNHRYRTSHGTIVTGAEMRALMERTVRYRGVDLKPREAAK